LTKSLADNPQALAAVLTSYGCNVIPGPTFRFEIPLENVREVIPKINELGVGVSRISEKTTDHPRRFGTYTVVECALHRK
jgi:hypothetical protein